MLLTATAVSKRSRCSFWRCNGRVF